MKRFIAKLKLLFRKKKKLRPIDYEKSPKIKRMVSIKGKKNQVLLTNAKGRKIKSVKGLSLTVKGNNNTVKIHNAADFSNMIIWVEGNNCYFEFEGSNRYIKDSTIKVLNGGSIKIGKDTSIINKAFIISNGTKITIGKDCMFASDVVIRDNDAHSVINSKGKVVNSAKEIVIGDHVWVGTRSIILKGAKIGNDCVVGAGSVVLSSTATEDNSLIAGNPAKITKRKINWIR